jgi:hypothetical protein
VSLLAGLSECTATTRADGDHAQYRGKIERPLWLTRIETAWRKAPVARLAGVREASRRARRGRLHAVGGDAMSGRLDTLAMAALLSTTALGAQAPGIQSVAWVHGCWMQVTGDRTVEEQWMAPRGGSMIGMSRTASGSRIREYEFIVIREEGGSLVYEAYPSGQAGASFRSVEIGEARAVFENSHHDFPQRVGYERLSPDRLLAWIEGTRNGKTRRVEFRYERSACAER